MTINKLASLIAQKEGKKSQSRIGDIREILKIIQVLIKDEIKNFDETQKAEVLQVLMSKAGKVQAHAE